MRTQPVKNVVSLSITSGNMPDPGTALPIIRLPVSKNRYGTLLQIGIYAPSATFNAFPFTVIEDPVYDGANASAISDDIIAALDDDLPFMPLPIADVPKLAPHTVVSWKEAGTALTSDNGVHVWRGDADYVVRYGNKLNNLYLVPNITSFHTYTGDIVIGYRFAEHGSRG